MKSKPTTEVGRSCLSKSHEKAAGKSVNMLHKKLLAKRTPIKLRPSTGKCVAKRSLDESPKLSVSSPPDQGCSVSTETARSTSSRSPATGKSKSLSQKKSAGDLASGNKKAPPKKQGIVKGKAQKNEKGNKEKAIKSSPKSFIDLWALATSGKREASLNASMKVNIMFERHSPSKTPKTPTKKAETGGQDSSQDENMKDKKSKGSLEEGFSVIKPSPKKSSDSLKVCSPSDKKSDKSSEQRIIPAKPDNRKTECKSKTIDGSSRKRKSPGYKIFKEESLAKARKVDTKSSIKSKNKIHKRVRKGLPSGHQLCNIIEKCPRQASLVARAMIAMGQEEDISHDLSARTKVYDWMELRSLSQAEARRIEWYNGLGHLITGRSINRDGLPSSKDDPSTCHVDVVSHNDPPVASDGSESLHSTLLKTLHHIGDSRLLKEYFRAQKEDFQGQVDVEKYSTPEKSITPEKCTTPEKCATPEKQQSSPCLKKNVSPQAADEKVDKEIEKPVTRSPVKLQPCRVATPVPQFTTGQRSNSTNNGFIHHPVPQPVFPQQHGHVIPQSIKVTSFSPSPAYIYQYAMDRPQGALYAPPSLSPVPYGVGNSEATHRDYTSTFTLGHVDSLTLSRRGVSSFQPAPYNTSVHLPMQPIGFNYGAYYPATMQALPQQSMPTMQTIPIHQQYPLMQTPVIAQHQIPPDIAQLEAYQHDYSAFPSLASVGQDAACMPPPPPPACRPTPMTTPAVPLRQATLSHHSVPSVTAMESMLSVNPVGLQPIVRPPALEYSPNFIHCQGKSLEQFPAFPSCRPHHKLSKDQASTSLFKYSVTCHGMGKAFSPCKSEQDDTAPYDCDFMNKNYVCSNECPPRSLGSSRTNSEGSDVSDLLHSAHSTMYQIDGVSSMDNIRELTQAHAAVSDSNHGSCSPSKMSILGHSSFNVSYSVSSILDKPNCKVKPEPDQKMCAASHLSNVFSFDQKVVEHPQSAFVCFASAGASGGSDSKETNNSSPNNVHKKGGASGQGINTCSSSSKETIKHEDRSEVSGAKTFIVIEDTDESSDDEPLARLVKAKSSDSQECHITEAHDADSHKKVNDLSKEKLSTSYIPKQQHKARPKQDKLKERVMEQKPPALIKVKKLLSAKLQSSGSAKCDDLKPLDDIKSVDSPVIPQHNSTSNESLTKLHNPATNTQGKPSGDKEAKNKPVPRKTALSSSSKSKKPTKKMKAQPVWPVTPIKICTNHGWSWVGEGQMRPIPKLTQGREELVRVRKSYKTMRHSSGETVSVRDCVILQSDGDGSIPFVAKVSALWENLNGEMMFSMLWYYQPEHTATGREPEDGEQELFASKHREENSVACIDDKCFVLMYNEYCRLEAEGVRHEQGVPIPRWRELMPGVSDNDKRLCRPLPPANTCADNIWFCRYDYDIRKKVVKKPKHKKSNLRYRAPCKIV